MKIEKNRVVSISYTLTLKNGAVADEVNAEHPFTFLFGIGQTLPAFDENLTGLEEGADFDFNISADQGYGEYNDKWVIAVPRDLFLGEDVPHDLIEVGNLVPMQDEHGNAMEGKVVTFDDNTVTMDFNHPLAGEALNFKGKVEKVRSASPEELDHGHVHGPGGHHH